MWILYTYTPKRLRNSKLNIVGWDLRNAPCWVRNFAYVTLIIEWGAYRDLHPNWTLHRGQC